MGDRGNIYVVNDVDPLNSSKTIGVYLYGHWSGSNLPEILANGLEHGQSRWGDVQYLTRILFDTLTGREGGETGYGISCVIGDNEYPILVVDDRTQVVRVMREGTERESASLAGWTYPEFIDLVKETLKDERDPWDVLKAASGSA